MDLNLLRLFQRYAVKDFSENIIVTGKKIHKTKILKLRLIEGFFFF